MRRDTSRRKEKTWSPEIDTQTPENTIPGHDTPPGTRDSFVRVGARAALPRPQVDFRRF